MISRSQVMAGGLAFAAFVAAPVVAQDLAGVPQAVGVPVGIEIDVDEASISAGRRVELTVTVTAEADLADVLVRFSGDGNVEVVGAADAERDTLARDESIRLSVPARFGLGGSSVHVDVEAVIADSGFPFGERGTLNALVRADRAFAGTDPLAGLQWQALDFDVVMGRIGVEDAALREMQLLAVDEVDMAPGTWDIGPGPAVGVPPVVDRGSGGDAAAGDTCTNITVQGIAQFQDENGTLHPVWGYQVQVWDDDFGTEQFIINTATGQDGTYSVTFDWTDPGGPDIFVRFVSENQRILVRPLGGTVPYENQHGTTNNVCSNQTIIDNITFANTGTGPVGSVMSGMTTAAVYVRDNLTAGVGLGQIPVEFPGSGGAAFYSRTNGLINIRRTDDFDWDVMHHEYGHYVMDSYNFENNPGGPHNLGDCISITQGSKDIGTRLAWGEGWPTFFGTSLQMELGLGFFHAPRVGDAVYADTINGAGGFSYSLELNSGNGDDAIGLGEDNEVAVQRVFYDLWDANSDSRDTLAEDDVQMFQALNGSGVTTMSAAWTQVRASVVIIGNANDLAAGAITTDHAIGPALTLPADGSTVQYDGNVTLAWTRAVGCDPSFDGDSFTVRFYNAATFAEIMAVPTTNSSLLLTSPDLGLLRGGSDFGEVLWAVDASNTAAPATGPYLGENFTLTVLQPCPFDCEPVPDGNVGINDFLTLLGQWGGPGSCDGDGGGVGINDFLGLLAAWGPCLRAPGCGVPGAGNCCTAGGNGTPFCDDSDCCTAVCAVDPFCCDVLWDNVCANAAAVEPACDCNCGAPAAGDCCASNGSPYCDDRDCCNIICDLDPFCCVTIWDSICASEAEAEPLCSCPLACGHPLAGDCCVSNGSPFCEDQDCCAAICLIDPFCCTTTWDNLCANEASAEPMCSCP